MRRAAGLLSVVVPAIAVLGSIVLASAVLAGCENENAAACAAFVAHHDSLPCAADTNPGVDCNAFSDYPCLIEDYFACLEEGHSCNEAGELVVDVVREDAAGEAYTCADLLNCER